MKKIFLIMSAVLLLTGMQVYASPFIDSNVSGWGTFGKAFTVDTNGSAVPGGIYTIENQRQNTDVWNSTFGGYKADSLPATDTSFTGYYLGTVTSDNNDNPADLTTLLNYYLGSTATYAFTKVDKGDTQTVQLAVTYGSGKTGTWSVAGSSPAATVSFYSVKAATEYALYLVNPALQSGDWTTAHLRTPNGKNIPEISHLTVTVSTTPVPEPATMLLFGTGIAGLAGIARRKKN